MKKSQLITYILLVSAVMISGCKSEPDETTEEHHEEPTNTVTLSDSAIGEINLQTFKVQSKIFTGSFLLTAEVKADQNNEALVGPLLSGRVQKVFVNTGQYVRKGDLLMTAEGLEIGELKASYLKTKAALEFAKANYERTKKLFSENIGSQKELLIAQADYEKANAEFKAEDKKIHSIGLSDKDIEESINEDHTSGTLNIRAPISGVIVERNVVTGQFVEPSENAFRILNVSSVWVDGQVFEKDIARIDAKAVIFFVSSAYPGEKFEGRISFVGQMLDEQTRTLTVRATLQNPKGKLKPHLFGEMHIPVSGNKTAIFVPESAVFSLDGNDFVFVKVSADSFIKRMIKIRKYSASEIEIIEGIIEGEEVVSQGVYYLVSVLQKDQIEGDEH